MSPFVNPISNTTISPLATTTHRPIKVLLVDSEPNTRQLISRILQADGYEVHEAIDGEQAFTVFQRLAPDLILLEAVIAQVDDLSLLNQIRQHDKTVGVLILSTLQSAQFVVQAFHQGADDFVSKPIALQTLRLHIRQLSDKVILRQQNTILQQQLIAANKKLSYYIAPPLLQSLNASNSLPQLGGERQIVTVLAIGLENVPELLSSMPPDTVVSLLNDYLSQAITSIMKHGGMVESITDDGLLVLFNAPIAQIDHAVRAVNSAIEILQMTAEWNETHRPPIQPYIGIHTGEVVVGNIGTTQHMHFTAIGDVVNLVKLFQEAAPSHAILLSADTVELCQSRAINWRGAQLLHMGPVIFRTRSHSVDVYKITWN